MQRVVSIPVQISEDQVRTYLELISDPADTPAQVLETFQAMILTISANPTICHVDGVLPTEFHIKHQEGRWHLRGATVRHIKKT